jgi:hypothetical protein
MGTNTVQLLKSCVRQGALQVRELFLNVTAIPIRSWYALIATSKAGVLKLEGFNTEASCSCAYLPLRHGLDGSWPWRAKEHLECEKLCKFEPAQNVSRAAACPLCRLLAHSVEHEDGDALAIPSLTRYRLGRTRSVDGSRADVWGFEADIFGKAASILPFAEDAALIGKTPAGYARMVQADRANTKCMVKWLQRCLTEHPKCKAMDKQISTRTRIPKYLVNAKTLKVLLVEKEVRYLALSYVWGGVAQPKVYGLHTLSVESAGISIQHLQLPRVLTDAIKLTVELGETYLWVDALCIDQENWPKVDNLNFSF